MKINIDKPLEKIIFKVEGWVETSIDMLPNMMVSILLLLLFVLLANISKRAARRLFSSASDNKVLSDLFGTVLYYSIVGLGIFIILGILGLEKTVTSLLAGVGVIGIALGFAFQDISANFISGVILAFKTPFRLNDVVDLNGIMGTIEKTTLRVTIIHTFQGQEVYIPNKDVLQNPIYNYTKLGRRRIDLPVGISYADDLAEVEKIVTTCIGNIEGVIKTENVIFDYYEFGASSINFNVRFWIEFPGPPELGFLTLRKKAIMEIKKAFDDHNITIPFPIRTLDFGIKGGVDLSESMGQLNSLSK